MTNRQDRIAGALLGVHAGDALGATVEFSPWSTIRERYPDGLREIVGGGPFDWPPGHATDDTDLTRAVLLAYLSPKDDPARAAADHMVGWLRGDWPGRTPGSTPRDIGGATAAGLRRYASTGDPTTSGAGVGQAGNGSLMRCIPTAVAVRDQARRVADSIAISAVTHDDPRCTASCAAYNEIAASLIDGQPVADAIAAGLATAESLTEPAVAEAIRYGQQLQLSAMARTGELRLANNGAGYVLDSLSLAIAAVADDRVLPDVLVDIVRLGNDTDTNGAIAGGLLGARDGSAAIPAEWVSQLQFADEFRAAANQLRFNSALGGRN